uniref:phospholipase A and acyltransferase 3-like n=1 Tax=Pristiophorus japonicus TaxID=55135 RepID=UPI00398F3DA3
MSNRKSFPDPKPGDLIEIFRGDYQHWAIYVGDGDVVHLTEGSSARVSSSSTTNIVVKRQRLSKVAGKDEYHINNTSDEKWDPLPIDEIIKNAKAKVGNKVEYELTTANCEHFVNELRCGKKVSDQGKEIESDVGAAGAAIVQAAGASVGVVVGAAADVVGAAAETVGAAARFVRAFVNSVADGNDGR